MFRWATLSPLNRVKSLTDRLGEATGPGFVETSPAREISSSAKDAERAKRQPVTASSLFVSDGFDALQELDIDCQVPITYCRSSSGDSVDLQSRTIYTTMVVSDWCIPILAHGWWVSILCIVGIIKGRNCFFGRTHQP